jgi:hypothetical protein
MNRAQRIVVVVALGLALVVAVWGSNLLMLDAPTDWFTYSPSAAPSQQTDTYFVVLDDSAVVQQVALGLSAIAVWTASGLWLLRTRQER